MRDPRPFAVIQNGTFLFIVHAYSLAQARTIVAAKVAGETIVVAVSLGGSFVGISRETPGARR